MNESATPDLECSGVSKSFGQIQAVKNVSFEIPSGSFFSILGPSGCGKTTLMRMIAGFEDPNEGDIRIKGRSVLNVAPNRRNVKMVFQHLALFPMMNVFENIAYGLRCIGTDRETIAKKVQDVLNRVALPDVGEREIHQLSGGQKQRIAIARCMVLDPDVLLLDEPLGALDLKLREAMKIELKLLQHQFDTTFVYITHDQSEALVMSDNVAVMNNGRFEQIGTPQELYHKPNTAFVAGFVGDSNRWGGKVESASGGQVVVETAGGMRARCRMRDGSIPQPGQAVELFVRPEFIELRRKAGGETENNPSGKVDSLLFNGANSRALVKLESGEFIEANVTLTGGTEDIRPGETVHLAWDPESAICFASGSGT
ncbi:MAG: ABC transporter ATP-binding protein [Nitratireductor sp.]|nr:ABC transporter ATP-binding protein [Nitratireductor sp.]